MINKDTNYKTHGASLLMNNDEYYRHVFKKTEKIVSAVFYTTRASEEMSNDVVVRDLEDGARSLIEKAHAALGVPLHRREEALQSHLLMLIALESRLLIACAARAIPKDVLEVFRHEVVSVERMLKVYLDMGVHDPFLELREPAKAGTMGMVPRAREERREPREGQSGSAVSGSTGRSERILAVIRDKGEATIKDISLLITDCSEKTVQRELIQLIKDNKVKREGERRWSRYSVL